MITTALIASFVVFATQGPAASPAPSQGIGDLLIAPTRLVLGESRRVADVNLLNIGDKPATYRISFVHQRMNAEGKLEDVATPGPDDKFADDLVRFTPRQVVLEPHIAQLVRVQLRLPADLAAGEYRSHLLFRAVPVPGGATEAPSGEQQKGIAIKITPIYGVSIPVIVRTGQTSASSGMEGLQLVTTPDGTQGIIGKLTRSGNASTYGQVVVAFAVRGGKFRTVGQLNGLAVYTPNVSRTFAIRVSSPDGVAFAGGTFKVTYREAPADGDRVFTESNLIVP